MFLGIEERIQLQYYNAILKCHTDDVTYLNYTVLVFSPLSVSDENKWEGKSVLHL